MKPQHSCNPDQPLTKAQTNHSQKTIVKKTKTTHLSNASILVAILAGITVATANAGPDITWQTPVAISDTSDVSTLGALYGTWAPGNDWGGGNRADYFPVNGVTFAAYGTDGANFGISGSGINMDRYNGFANPNTADANYNYLLQTAIFNWNASSSSMIASWNNMTPGNTYLVQLWLNDGRSGQPGTSTFTGGANTSAPVAIGDSTPGQYIIGTFVADGSRAQSVTMSPGIMLNLVQVRDVTPKPAVTWRTPVTISDPSDVITQGTYFGSWAPQNANANTLPVNGVTFQGFSDLPYARSGPTFDAGYDGYASPGTSDANYNTLLQYARYSNAGTQPATVSWSGMTPGKTYLIQLWVHDGRNIGESRAETVTGGANTSDALSFGSDGSGPGQYIVGTFVANSSGGQTLILNASSTGANPSPQINLLQVRDITPVITSFAVSGPTLTMTATNGPANGEFVLLQSASMTVPVSQWTPVLTNSFDGSGNLFLSANVVAPGNPQAFYALRTQ
jgi:hypothetical protein